MYAIGQGTSETLLSRTYCSMSAKLAKKINFAVHTTQLQAKVWQLVLGQALNMSKLRFVYMQDFVARGLKKVGTKVNCADPLTKNLSGDILKSHLVRLCVATVYFHYNLEQGGHVSPSNLVKTTS